MNETGNIPLLFENLPDLLKPKQAAVILNVSRETIYDWHYRRHKNGLPDGLFLAINRRLYLRTDVLKKWIASQNPVR